MSRIKKLSPLLISKIAAGEVIERPAYAVKELVENAIDAEANNIRIDIEKAGLQKISVQDNGIGMTQEDLELAVLPHTTSKLYSAEALHSITSKGFRGEALASIAAMSDLTLQSRTKDTEGGTHIEVSQGNVLKIKPIGMPVGTTVIVENLFDPVPARKKFLRAPQTEFRHILDSIVTIALAHPEIRFFVTHNKKTILDIPRHKTLQERVHMLLGDTLFQHFIPVSFEESYITMAGFISKPQIHSTAGKQYFFVNNRRISDQKIAQTIKETYGTLLDPHTQPIVVLFFDIPHEMVDVNVHPRKEQVHFYHQQIVLQAIAQMISETLQQKNLTFQDKRWKKGSNSFDDFLLRDGSTKTYAGSLLRDEVKTQLVEDKKPIDVHHELAQFHNLYLVTQTDKGIMLVDQHAAHERVLYEEFTAAFAGKKTQRTQHVLHKAVLLNLSAVDAEIMRNNLHELQQLGFEIEEFTSNTFKINAVPELFQDRNITELLLEMIEDLSQEKSVKTIDIRSHRMLTYLACRSAIKSGDTLSDEERKNLLTKLSACKNSFTCPHGRPTHIEISLQELAKMFKRT